MAKSRDEIVAERQTAALDDFMENGPGLRWSMVRNTYVVAKNTEDDEVYLGGLGSFGIGRMWVKGASHHEADPTFADAPEARRVPGDESGFGAVDLDGNDLPLPL